METKLASLISYTILSVALQLWESLEKKIRAAAATWEQLVSQIIQAE